MVVVVGGIVVVVVVVDVVLVEVVVVGAAEPHPAMRMTASAQLTRVDSFFMVSVPLPLRPSSTV